MRGIHNFIDKYGAYRLIWFLDSVNRDEDHAEIARLLGVSPGRVSQWKKAFFRKKYYLREDLARSVKEQMRRWVDFYTAIDKDVDKRSMPEELLDMLEDPNSNNWKIHEKYPDLSMVEIKFLRERKEFTKRIAG